MGSGGSTSKSHEVPPSPPKEGTAGPAAAAAPQAAPAPKADGETSASQVVGGAWTKPKGPSPDDEKVVAEWKADGRLFVLEGVWCAVPYKVTVINTGGVEAPEATAQKTLDDVATEVEKTFSHFIEDSEVSAINKLAADTVHVPSEAMKQVLNIVSTINRMTRGVFDPAILPLTQHYKKNQCPASPDLIARSKWSSFKITDEGLMKTNAEAMMDLCGLAKGWAIDQMSQKLKDLAGPVVPFIPLLFWGGVFLGIPL